jgi:hypothetical protein
MADRDTENTAGITRRDAMKAADALAAAAAATTLGASTATAAAHANPEKPTTQPPKMNGA